MLAELHTAEWEEAGVFVLCPQSPPPLGDGPDVFFSWGRECLYSSNQGSRDSSSATEEPPIGLPLFDLVSHWLVSYWKTSSPIGRSCLLLLDLMSYWMVSSSIGFSCLLLVNLVSYWLILSPIGRPPFLLEVLLCYWTFLSPMVDIVSYWLI